MRVFSSGTSRGESPVNYLLSKTDHTGQQRDSEPEVLAGQPATTVDCINNISRKHKYVSGAIAFKDTERPTKDQLQAVIRAFKATMCPGLEAHEFNSLFVLHNEKYGGCHVHFIFPMVAMRSGRSKQMNIHPPGETNLKLYEAFTQIMNHEMGYEQVQPDPLKLALSDFGRRTSRGNDEHKDKLYLHKRLTRAIRQGHIINRDQLCDFLAEHYGVEVTRRGADYVSLKFPGAAQAKRFRGPFYELGSDYRQLVRTASEKTMTLSAMEVRQVRRTVADLVRQRHTFNQAAFTPRRMRAPFMKSGRDGRTDQHKTNNNKENETMKSSNTSTATVIQDVLRVVSQVRAERAVASVSGVAGVFSTKAHKATAINNIQNIRRSARATTDGTRQPAVMETTHDVEAAINSLQGDINAAISDIASATTPEQRSNAERRLATLMEQKRRLEAQLGMAKIRQINRPK